MKITHTAISFPVVRFGCSFLGHATRLEVVVARRGLHPSRLLRVREAAHNGDGDCRAAADEGHHHLVRLVVGQPAQGDAVDLPSSVASGRQPMGHVSMQ